MDVSVVLTQDDPKLGKRGEVVKVSSGYAQNFLFPHRKAQPATAANLKFFDAEKARTSKEDAERLLSARELAGRLKDLRLNMEVSSGEGEKLFGSVTSQDIAEALAHRGISLDRKKIHLDEPLKRLGSYEVPVKLHPQINVSLKVELTKKP